MAGTGENTQDQGGVKEPFFSGGADEVTGSYGAEAIGPGVQVGPFKLLGILGEGGYGIVYLAAQEQPIRRRVALKVIKPGMDSRQVIARFEAERQALALLDHPNIAHVYDAGTTPEGRPYFAMEYIEGVPITEYCDRQRLTIRERLQLFLQVCSAVQHAHQKGIIHRDLKPSNILVTGKDGEARIRIIDFGIAKALAQSLTEKTLYTEQGQFIGTPDYMSPEQAEMDAHGVDTRSDVYSLGVVLYELLTGVLPFDPDALRAGGVDHIRTVIREEEPRTPSTRLTGLGEETKRIAERRQTDLQTLAKSLRRELEWIPLKAMRKESSRRYQSVSELADDVENYLRGAPLLAGPESAAYRAKKFVQRHTGAVVATGVVMASVTIGFVVSTTMYFRAEGMRIIADDARASAETAQTAEAEHRQSAERERDRAIKAQEEATRHLADLYEEQGRRYMELGDLDRALVLLTEALKSDSTRLTTRLLAEECLRRQPDPNLSTATSLVPWKGERPGEDVSFATSPDRKLIAFVDAGDPVVRIFDTETAEPKIQLQTGRALRLAFVPGNQHLLVQAPHGPSHHSISVFDLNTGERVTSIRRASADIDKLMACPYGTLPPRNVMERSYNGILLSRAGDWFAFLDVNDTRDAPETQVVFWDFSNRKLHRSPGYPFANLLTNIVFRTRSSYGHPSALVAGDCQQTCYCWDVPQFTPAGSFRFAVVNAVIAGTRMIVQKPTGEAELLDRTGNRGIRVVPRSIAFGFSPDAARLITKSLSEPVPGTVDANDGVTTDLWEARHGERIACLGGAAVENWHFSPDSRFLVTEHRDGGIRIWLSQSGKPVFAIPPEVSQEATDISPDNRWLVTRDRQTASLIGIWNLATGEHFQPYTAQLSWHDIGAGWTIGETDALFPCSQQSPGTLPRFNASGSALMGPQGLLPFHTDASSLVRLVSLVSVHIGLRFENGRIRPASQEETCLARLEYHRRAGTERSTEAIADLLHLASRALERNDLARGSTFLRSYLALLPIDDSGLTDRGSDLMRTLSDAYLRNGDQEERVCRYGLAIESYRQALLLRADDPETLRRLSWVLATCPDRVLRNTGEALATAERACVRTDWQSWQDLYTYAVASAAHGCFADAVRVERKAVELLPPSERERWMENLRKCLQLFEANQSYDWRHLCNLPDRNLLCWWAFDDLNGVMVRDRSGLGHTAMLSGDIQVLTADGHTVLQFRGPEASARCPNVPDLNVTDILTVVAWVKYAPGEDQDEASQQVVGKGQAWALCVTHGTCLPYFNGAALNVPASAPHSRVTGKTPLNDGRWHQLAAAYDGQALSLYVDGILDAAVDASGSLVRSDEGIALSKGSWSQLPWRGLMREARVYNRALSAAEITRLYEETK